MKSFSSSILRNTGLAAAKIILCALTETSESSVQISIKANQCSFKWTLIVLVIHTVLNHQRYIRKRVILQEFPVPHAKTIHITALNTRTQIK